MGGGAAEVLPDLALLVISSISTSISMNIISRISRVSRIRISISISIISISISRGPLRPLPVPRREQGAQGVRVGACVYVCTKQNVRLSRTMSYR